MRISVVTECYNASKAIEETLLSVINQTYEDVEYIVIDGGSTDGTVDIIKKYSDKISYWVSEPDKGIYDAMNKGIDAATGDWINFMNAGDTFCSNHTIENLFKSSDIQGEMAEVVYGNIRCKYEWGMEVRSPEPLNKIMDHMPFCHQAVFVKTSLMKNNHFNIRYRYASDYEFFYNIYLEHGKFIYVPVEIADYDILSGVSYMQSYKVEKEYAIINGKIESNIWKMQNLLRRIIMVIKNFIKKILPHSLVVRVNKRNILNSIKKSAN